MEDRCERKVRAVDWQRRLNDANTMRLLAPAKINLHLRVFGVQSDGFHPLLSWMSTVGLFDRIEIERTENGIALTCDDPSIPCDARNLVFRAANLMLAQRPRKPTALPWDPS